MATLPDLLFVVLFAVALPLWDSLFFWPAFQRRSHADAARARRRLWAVSIGSSWALIAVGAALWVGNGRSWASLGLSVPDGWRLWTSIALCVLLAAYYAYASAMVARDPGAREKVRLQIGKLAAVMPQTRPELAWFGGLSLTAGFCEEFLYRGFLVWAFSPWLGWWGAAALSLALFAAAHLYQGWGGVLRTGIVGALLTFAVAIFDSLWPAIALHALVDVGAGVVAWLALRDGQSWGG